MALSSLYIHTLLLVAAATFSSTTVEGFQWMSKFKMPTYNPNEERIAETFGERSE